MLQISPWGSRADRIIDGAAIATLALLAIIAAVTFKDYGLGWDDYTQSQYGDLLVHLYGSGFTDRRALSFVNLYAYGGGYDLASALIAKILPFELFETRRLVGAAIGIVGIALTWRIARRVGGPLAGLIAMALLATSGIYYGHMFINCKDTPFAVAMMLTLFGLVRAFEDYPRPSYANVAIVAIGFGLAFGSRILGGFALLYGLVALLTFIAIEWRRSGLRVAAPRARQFVLAFVPSVLLAYAVMALVWPWSVVEPLNPLQAVAYFSTFFEVPWRELFAGMLIRVPDMPRNYLPQMLAVNLSEIFLVLGITGLIGAIVASFRRDLPANLRTILVLLAAAVLSPIAVAIIRRPAMYNGIRHFVFLLPPLAALAGIAGAWLIGRAARVSRVAATIALALAGAALLPPIATLVALHPYEYAYYNALAGGVQGARDRYMLDYWGLSFKQATAELRAKLAVSGERPSHGKWRVATCGPQSPAQQELGPDFEVSWETKDADFALMLGEYYCVRIAAPVLVEIKRDDVVFSRVYDIRGRSVPTLLAIPAP